RLLALARLEGLDDGTAGGQVHDRRVREWVVAAAELEEHPIDGADVDEIRLDPPEQIEGVVVSPTGSKAAPEALVLGVEGIVLAHGFLTVRARSGRARGSRAGRPRARGSPRRSAYSPRGPGRVRAPPATSAPRPAAGARQRRGPRAASLSISAVPAQALRLPRR